MIVTDVTVGVLGQLASLAIQYGPFLMALIFVLVVPYTGQRWFSKILQTKLAGSDQERLASIEVYEFYWKSGILCGLVLTGISVAWWIYVQMSYALPSSEEQFNRRVSEALARRVIEGTILGASDEDIFLPADDTRYKVYMYERKDLIPMKVEFLIRFLEDPGPDLHVQVEYINKRAYDNLRVRNKGYFPALLQLCPKRDATALLFVKDPKPSFDQNCGG